MAASAAHEPYESRHNNIGTSKVLHINRWLHACADGPGSLERKFREWLAHCHATLDKRIRFCGLADAATQACP